MKKTLFTLIVSLIFVVLGTAQIPTATHIQILKAEDARRYDKTLEDLLRSPNADIRTRAALAAGRIGNEAALPLLHAILKADTSVDAREMAAFAIGEIESIRNTYALLDPLKTETDPRVRSRIIEAAGKMAAANPTNAITPALKRTILEALAAETDRQSILAALTAALRARPDGSDVATAKFLTHTDARVRSDAANALTRMRAKNANETLRSMLATDTEATARANAARALGAAEDKDAFDLLVKAAIDDKDSRVRVSAIRSLGSLKNADAAAKLIERGNALMALINKTKRTVAPEMNEALEIATTLGRLLPETKNEVAMSLLNEFLFDDRLVAPEAMVAMVAIYPESMAKYVAPLELGYRNPKYPVAYAQAMQGLAASKDATLRQTAAENLRSYIAGMATGVKDADQPKFLMALPAMMRALAAFKPDNLDEILRGHLKNDNIFIRATAAELLGERPVSKENLDALKSAASRALLVDKTYNDAHLAIIQAAFKLDKKESLGVVISGLDSRDFVVRKKALELLRTVDTNVSPGAPSFIDSALRSKKDQVQPYSPIFGTKLGQVLNIDADYRRALLRKNGTVKAVLTTEKGTFTIDLYPEEAPLTVDNFVKLARARYFDGLEVHRVVPNFVMQDGDPRGDGNGGPGWSIRCEVNMREYGRGAVGMALSGKDTGGSQWFVTHAPQPHLDGGYTVFGQVNEPDMKVVDSIVRGDKIISVRILGR